ncbi:MAG: cytochrome d ubiquinol oxidase subunit II [Tepidisphaeraceae bacterium]|jgi:cytochrome d ubiquinol oxidase subunit II
MTLNAIWFILIFVLLGGYAVLDGFDLGAGVLVLFSRDEDQRRHFINAIAPVWDGNEVWLLTGAGALFAAFPPVYATVFSGFYLALMLVLVCLIFRAVSIEFRGKVDSASWRRVWDTAFGISSLLVTVLFGVALGNVLRGVSIADDGSYGGSFFDLLNPFALIVGLLALAACTMHGAIYLSGKNEPSQIRLTRIGQIGWAATLVLFVAATATAIRKAPSLLSPPGFNPFALLAVILLIAAGVTVPLALRRRQSTIAFIASSVMIAAMMALAAIGLFPRLLPATNDPSRTLTIYNSSSSHLTLLTMFIIALVGMPLVIAYTAVIHHVFRGKVVITPDSY